MCSRASVAFTCVVALVVGAPQKSIFNEGGLIYFPGQEIPHTLTTTVRPRLAAIQGERKSIQMCRKYETQCVRLTRTSIDSYDDDYDQAEPLIINGTAADTSLLPGLILNGTDAKPTEFPHMALIGFDSFLGVQWRCGGSLISEQFVLSAAHCNDRAGGPKYVRLGDYNMMSNDDENLGYSKPQEFKIIQVITHPEYDQDRGYNDITLYKLDRPVVFDRFIKPICLHTEYKIPTSNGILSGWGGIEYGGPMTDILQKGNVSFIPEQECNNAIGPIMKQRDAELKDKMMLCAANFVNGTDTCQGDSGGPLQYLRPDSCMYSQVGITSFGVKCGNFYGQPKYPAIYTRVSSYIQWIETNVWP
ncbi:venom protease-like [Macrosteles quadrilineatus]|uniref:venom protease-like n=1 Tax=Macrosteles quadrilineatus TaxID=74068 RepID=UPI0023E0E427|nr:venom protease-like [Macrosteles quadrilineatus]